MRNVYTVELEQTSGGVGPYTNKETLDVLARSAEEAIRKARKAVMSNGFLKSRPVEIRSLQRIASDLI